jgi:hypothetical protein
MSFSDATVRTVTRPHVLLFADPIVHQLVGQVGCADNMVEAPVVLSTIKQAALYSQFLNPFF